mmetsp:Transcript_113788/g.355814  ORF Transcript_113788/g.355814 Transcript_113788/m.355814 type:complete len:311 (-) Transcript_113788:81-1013(-)
MRPTVPPTVVPTQRPAPPPMAAPTGIERPKVRKAGTMPRAVPTAPPARSPTVPPTVPRATAPPAAETAVACKQGLACSWGAYGHAGFGILIGLQLGHALCLALGHCHGSLHGHGHLREAWRHGGLLGLWLAEVARQAGRRGCRGLGCRLWGWGSRADGLTLRRSLSCGLRGGHTGSLGLQRLALSAGVSTLRRCLRGRPGTNFGLSFGLRSGRHGRRLLLCRRLGSLRELRCQLLGGRARLQQLLSSICPCPGNCHGGCKGFACRFWRRGRNSKLLRTRCRRGRSLGSIRGRCGQLLCYRRALRCDRTTG